MSEPEASGGVARQALLASVTSYLIWGFVPLLFQFLGHSGVGAWEIVAQRTVWGVPVALILVLLANQWPQVRRVIADPKLMAWLALSSLLIAVNWITYILAVNSGQLIEGSLGYYINPLINMAAGALIFRERLDRLGLVAIGAATVGVGLQAVALGHVPVIALILGFSFAAYGVVRKQINADAQTGLFIEFALLSIPGVIISIWLQYRGVGHFFGNPLTTALLMASGALTVAPLVLFSWAARRMPLSAMGFLQFIGPTIGLIIGLIEGEAFGWLRAVSFFFIWGGALIYAIGTWRAGRRLAAIKVAAAP